MDQPLAALRLGLVFLFVFLVGMGGGMFGKREQAGWVGA